MSELGKSVRKSDVQISEHLTDLGYEVTGVETVTTNTIKGFGLKIVRKTTTFWKYRFSKR
ncbi:hypothetical protein [Hellea balneolensis]|uniref:hypothetical protein n=1 Tax=Hellea balneolensis TaxID=287478 RepID=UPI00041276D5|nr:hypothetical protein [Hellea balneolensis]